MICPRVSLRCPTSGASSGDGTSRWLTGALALLLTLAPVLKAEPAAPVVGDRAEAAAQDKLTVERLKRDHDYKAALDGFAKAHDLDPAYPEALFHMGLMSTQLEDWPAAIRYYEAFKALDNTSDLYVQVQLKLDEARRNQKVDATPEGKRKRQAEAAQLAAEKARARLGQDVDEAERQLGEYDRQVAEALKNYLPTSQKVADLRQARDRYYKQAEPRLVEALDAREAELAVMAREMRPTAAPVAAKQKEVDRLRQLCRQKVTNTLDMNLAFIAPGEFTMGSSANEKGRSDIKFDEIDIEIQHRVTLSKGFYMGTTPVTRKQWKAVMKTDPSGFKGDDLPVTVSWDDALEFCQRLSAKEAKGKYRLPTEAEWEYACRAGTTGAYGGTGNLDEMGWNADNSGQRLHPVAQKQPNAWGLYDMHGNVWQWCNDCAGAYAKGAVTDPTGPRPNKPGNYYHVSRGGSFDSPASVCRAAQRCLFSTIERGFRVCLDP